MSSPLPSDSTPFYYVIFRACDRVNAVNGVGRPGGIQKTSLVKACFGSLEAALKEVPHRIVVLGDKLSDELVTFFGERDVKLVLGSYGNDESIRQSLALALDAPADSWIYFCEDDYFHAPNAFVVIDDLIRNRESCLANSMLNFRTWFEPANARHLVIFPSDYPDRYKPRLRQYSLLYVAGVSHWRQVRNITFTFLTNIDTVRKFAAAIRTCSTGARDGRLSSIMFRGFMPRNSALCLSPLPGVAAHMHLGTMSPLIDWPQLLDQKVCAALEQRAHGI